MPEVNGVQVNSLVMLDNFHDTDDVLLEDHQPILGPDWTEKLGDDMKISGNKLVGVTDNPNPLYLFNAENLVGIVDFRIDLALSDTQVALHVAQNQQSRDGFMAVMYPSTNKVELYQTTVTQNLLATIPYTFIEGLQRWKVSLVGGVLSVVIEGDELPPVSGLTPINSYWGIEFFHPGAAPASEVWQYKQQTG